MKVASLLYRGRVRYYIEDKVGVCIIDSIPHCHTKKLSKESTYQEMWLRFYIEGGQNFGEYIIDSIPHCPTENAFLNGKNKDM